MLDTKLFHYVCREEKQDNNQVKYIFEWNIPDFKWLLDNQTNREIRTQDAWSDDNELSKFMFQFRIKFLGHNNDLIEIYTLSKSTVFTEKRIENLSRSVTFESREYLMDRRTLLLSMIDYKYNYETIDDLRLKFEFTVRLDNPETELPNMLPAIEEHYKMKPQKKPKKNVLESQLMNPEFSDVIIKTEDDEEIPAHKIMLIRNSVVFKEHFEQKTEESLTNIVKVPFESAVVKDLLSYIYTDNIPNIKKTARSLLKAADFYEMDELKLLCEKRLHCHKHNAIEILTLACLHRAEFLKQKSQWYIANYASEIVQTEAWKTLQIAEVVKSLYEYWLYVRQQLRNN